MKFKFMGASLVTGMTTQLSMQTYRDLPSMEDAISVLEEHCVLYDETNMTGFMPVAFACVDEELNVQLQDDEMVALREEVSELKATIENMKSDYKALEEEYNLSQVAD